MSEVFGKNINKKAILKDIIKKLHEGTEISFLKEESKEILKQATPTEIAKIEEELIREGMPQDEIHELCDIHIALFRESLEKAAVKVPPGHPVYILMEEHKLFLKTAEDLKNFAQAIENKDKGALKSTWQQLKTFEQSFKDSESHYVREENVLFPYLEKHGITQPPAIMWIEHDKIREIKKNIYSLIAVYTDKDFAQFITRLKEATIVLAETLANHFYKENNILFPIGLKVILNSEWNLIRKEFDELGYCPFTPEAAKTPFKISEAASIRPEKERVVSFETGNLSFEEIEMMFNSLPVDVTFVDKDDTVRYFSQTKERIFPRTKAVIGRKVQQCHPQKSIHVVNQILDDFKNGSRDKAEFWINMNNTLIYIRYFPVRNKNGEYLGCLEVTQDITGIKKIEGEKRLL